MENNSLRNEEKLNQECSSKSESPSTGIYSQSLTVFLPENLDLEELIKENPPVDIPAFHIDNIKYILHLINYLPAVKKDNDSSVYSGYVPLNKQKLQSSGIYHYRKYLNYLLRLGIIWEDEYYINGEKSKGIRFPDEYTYCKVKKDKITKKTLIKAIIKNSVKKNNDATEEQLPYLTKWWNDGDLEIAYEPALLFLDERLEKSKDELMKKYKLDNELQLKNLLEKNKHKRRNKLKIKNLYEQYNSAIQVVERLHRKEYLMKVDDTSGRLHTLLTQLPKGLRKFVTFKRQKLVSIDLRNSQPLLAVAILNREIFNNNPILLSTILRNNPSLLKSPSTMLVNHIYRNQNKPDVLKYKEIVSKGKYYEEFGKILQERGLIPIDIFDVRKLAKEITYSSFFASNLHAGFIMGMRLFKKSFPSVYHIFSRIKYNPKGVKVKEKRHRALSVCLQAFEAELFLNRICKRINELNTDIPIFTIHDSVVTTFEYQEFVQNIVKDEIHKAIRIVPMLNIEKWCNNENKQ